ncbi:hypothetical protein Rumeso_04189 [Rubellimicrobium mesophilum DSM 19309]|uniref:Uncharacterized protein n=1 Tax=Rubellimicrobium mesophilum DSM 19309 TaxID=442562 RepID=A0A017HJB2_9RHOB|nr:hypothetical protein [Rubellimicrobium mesophilum]EYD74253.1 hypothetical protein Rumeso_04189 [Rubellimicrobium mesophilum DSM 19309]
MPTVKLTPTEMAELMRDNSGSGGWQSLMNGLQAKLDKRTGELRLSPSDLERIPRYAFDYGNGGWESRLRSVFGRHLGPRLGR